VIVIFYINLKWTTLSRLILISFIIPSTTFGQGLSLDWAFHCPTRGQTTATSIVLDQNENSYITGSFDSIVDFDPGPGTYNLSSNGLVDIFIQKIDSSGNLVWVYSFGSSGGDSGNSITIDNQGDIYITGTFRGTIDFNPGIGISNLTVPPTSSWGIFILKLDANGNFIWAKSIDDGSGNSIEVDSFNNVYITGGFGGGTIDFDPGPGVYNLTSTTINRDVFVLKLTSNGDFIWAVGYGSSANEAGLDIHIDNAYNVYISGYFKTGTVVDFNPGTGIYNLISNGNDDAFIQKLDSSGVFIWAKSFGGTGYEIVKDVVTDNNGNVYAIGQFDWTVDFDPSPGVFNLISLGGNADNFVVKLDVNGNFVWANSTGGLNVDITTDIEIDDFGDLYISGWFQSNVDFDPGPGVYMLYGVSGINGGSYMQKLDTIGNFIWANGGNKGTVGGYFEITSDGNIYSAGRFWVTSDFDPEISVYQISIPPGGSNLYIQKLNQCINPTLTINQTGCGRVNSTITGVTWYTSGTYYETIPVIGQCDSTVIVNVTIINSSSSFFNAYACSTYTPPSGVGIYTTSGTYTDTLYGANSLGCDSIITIFLSINNSDTIYNRSVCDSLTSPSGNFLWTTSGNYNDTISNHLGCDSVITINLSVLNGNSYFINQSSCETYTSPSGNYTWTTSGSYQDTLQSSFGCDSVLTINLSIYNKSSSTIYQTSCNSYTSPSGNNIYLLSGSYVDTLVGLNSYGCDSIITINLTINNSSYANISPVECFSYLSPSGINHTNSGNYVDTLFGANSNGCDSIIAINLTINSVDNAITISPPTLSANSITGSFQWLNCESLKLISGGTNQSYTPSENGSFAVIVTENGCQDTSKCESIFIENILTIPNTITPNGDGINDVWIIDNIEFYPNNEVEIFNRNGSSIFKSTNYNNNWGGQYNGQDLPATTYYYIIDLGSKILNGDLSIIRE